MAYHKCASIYGTNNSAASVQTASGAIANFSTQFAMPLIKSRFNFKATQDLHGQSGPYPAGGSAQIWDEQWELGSISTVTGEKSGSTANIRTKNVIKVTENTRYSIIKPSGNQMFILFYKSDNTVIQYVQNTGDIGVYNLAATVNASAVGGTFTTPAETDHIMFRWDGITTYSTGVSINYPSTDTAYHPYSNICPISGVSAVNLYHLKKNVFNPELCVLENYYEVNPDRTVKVLASNSKSWDTLPEIPIKAGTYTVSKTVAGGRLTIRTALSNYESNAVALLDGQTSASFTVAEDTKFRIKIMTSYSSYPVDVGIMIELGSTATAYEPYNSSTTLINLGGTYYGGYVEQDKDGHRQLVVTHKAFTFTGSESWKVSTNFFYLSAGMLEDTPIQQNVIGSNGMLINPMTNKQIRLYPNYGINQQYISMESTVADIQGYLSNGIQFLYELAEPFTIALPDGEPIKTFPSINNIFCDTGDTSLQFIKLGN